MKLNIIISVIGKFCVRATWLATLTLDLEEALGGLLLILTCFSSCPCASFLLFLVHEIHGEDIHAICNLPRFESGEHGGNHGRIRNERGIQR